MEMMISDADRKLSTARKSRLRANPNQCKMQCSDLSGYMFCAKWLIIKRLAMGISQILTHCELGVV